MTTQTSKVNIGTLIHGTLRNEDLFDAFANELERIGGKDAYESAVSDFPEDMSQILADDGEMASEIIFALTDALNDYAPPHTYFGTHEGDGSDFGFWGEIGDSCDEHVQINAEDFICIDHQVHVNINDHGNVTTYDLNRNEIWSVV